MNNNFDLDSNKKYNYNGEESMSGKIIKFGVFLLGLLLFIESIMLYSMGYEYILYIISLFLGVIVYDELPKHDSLTKTYTYNSFKKKISSKKNMEYIVYIDIDDFSLLENILNKKKINKLIKNISIIVKGNFKKDIISRKFKDTFVVCTAMDKENLIKKIKTIHAEIQKIQIDDNYSVSSSFGISVFDNENIDLSEWKAYVALKNAKKLYGEYYSIYDDEMLSKLKNDKKVADELTKTIANKKPIVYYQPIYSVNGKKICKSEALVRLASNNEIVPAANFIPIAQKTGHIKLIDRFVIKEVFSKINETKKEGKRFVKVAINISRESIEDNTFIDYIYNLAKKYNIEKDDVEFEIVEDNFNRVDVDTLNDRIVELSNNYNISLDDFGTCYSNLLMLSKFNVKTLKIDKSFVNKIGNEKDQYIIKNIINLAKELKVETVAEGVETEEEYNYLKKVGCDMVQGFMLSKPVNYDDFKKML